MAHRQDGARQGKKEQWRCVAAAALVLVCIVAGCDSGSALEREIVGKWEPTDSPGQVVFEFQKNGVFKATIASIGQKGKYKITGEDTIELSGAMTTSGQPEEVTVKIDGDSMTFGHPEQGDIALKRIE